MYICIYLVSHVLSQVPSLMEHCISPTLGMITKNFEDFPDHRKYFFELLEAVSEHAFSALIQLDCSLIINSLVWAFKHLDRAVAERGLRALLTLLRQADDHQARTGFYQTFFVSILQDVLNVLTDSLHKSNFSDHAAVLMHLFIAVVRPGLTSPSL